LLLAGAARADSAAQPREQRPLSGQARQEVIELRELDLQLAFAAQGAAREDVENKLRAIEDLEIEGALQVAKLGGREVVVEDDEVGAERARLATNFLHLAPADQGCGIGSRRALQCHTHNFGTRADGEFAKLL
jgi:hypothetical protein